MLGSNSKSLGNHVRYAKIIQFTRVLSSAENRTLTCFVFSAQNVTK